MQVLIDKHYCHQMPLYEAIYRLLNTLMPELRTLSAGEMLRCTQEWQAEVTIASQDRYTTMLALNLSFDNHILPDLHMRLRSYHDAKVAEVTEYQGQAHLHPVYRYPNPAGFQADEKRQINLLLLEWLMHIRQHGATLRIAGCC